MMPVAGRATKLTSRDKSVICVFEARLKIIDEQ